MRDSIKAVLGCAVFILFLFSFCSGDDASDGTDDNSDDDSTYSYVGPGSEWSIERRGDTASISYREAPGEPVELTVETTVTQLTSGFLELTVVSSSGANGPAAGEQAIAMEVPGVIFLLKPLNGDQIISMVASGQCPEPDSSGLVDLNWIMTKKEADVYSGDSYGTFRYDDNDGSVSLPTRYALENPTVNLGSQSLSSPSCANGYAEVNSGSSTAAMYFTANGGAMVNTDIDDEANSSFILGMPAKAAAGSADDLAGEYYGLVFEESDSGEGQITTVVATVDPENSSAEMSVESIDVGSTTAASDISADINWGPLDSPSNGFTVGSINAGSGGTITCMLDINPVGSGTPIAFCVGTVPDGNNDKLFNALFVHR